ncbi:AAA family ATPase [Agrococcus sp. HG114]|uniref:helix-turn-helix transcriptional regulator n=1 Tax=Agrococcus sp. HG114 TaxID=2969757 RepID=UPI00215B2734|nr:AAA family ATPase [Agrococcus sp. HG114]MCR8671255.1 AAA family ATPase [Agrococcus sp. HG114]
MVGRTRELEALRSAHRASLGGTPRGAVIAGEAGIGKTRLLDDFLASLDDGVAVAVGRCVALGSLPTPLKPIRDVLRDLLEHFGLEAVRAAAAPVERTLAAVLPELADGEPGSISQAELHDAVSLLLERLSAVEPLVVAFEDVHWTDLPTLDLLRSLLRTLRRGRVLVVLSYRSDDLGRGHALRPFLLELERARDMTRIELTRLGPDEAAEQLRLIRGRAPDARAAAALVARSDGIPFFIEELASLDGAAAGAMPETLRELVLGRYARLSPSTQAVVRLLAAGGERVEHRLVERVHDGEPEAFEAAIREAIDAHVLRADATGYSFRHSLTHEAVHDELLPGERRRFHARFAEALESLEALEPRAGRSAEIAHHWREAGDDERTFSALVAAAREAHATGAPLAAAQLGERALTLWPRVADAEERSGGTQARLFLEVARAYGDAGDSRALPVLERALEAVPESDRLGRALLLHEAMVVRHGDGLPGALALARQALDLVPDEPGDDAARAARARVLTGLGVIESLEHLPGARDRLEQAAAYARALMGSASDPRAVDAAKFELVRALTNLSRARAIGGDPDGALAGLGDALRLSGDDPVARLRHAEQATWLLHHLGRHAQAAGLAERSREAAAEAGMERGFGAEIALLGAQSLIALGELAAAAGVAARVRATQPARTSMAYCASVEAELLVLHDDPEGAAARLAEVRLAIDDMRATDANDDMHFGRAIALLSLGKDDLHTAWAQVERLWEWPAPEPGPSFPLLSVGALVLARMRRSAAEPARMTAEEGEERLLATLDEVAVWDVADDWRAVIEAQLSGADRAGADIDAWRAAEAAAARGRLPVRVHVHTLYRLADALLVAGGERDEAASALEQALETSTRCGFLHAVRLLEALAGRARLSLPSASASHRGPRSPELTTRERQVLELVAQGLTNRQIGQRLFISDKTASVHVSAILRKLGAATRAEAAARAAALLG